MIAFLKSIGPYQPYVILALGVWRWRELSKPLRVFLAGSIVLILAGWIKKQNPEWAQIFFYLNPVFGTLIFAYLFHVSISSKPAQKMIWLFSCAIIALICWYMATQSTEGFKLWVLIPYDIFMVTFCCLSIAELTYRSLYPDKILIYFFCFLLAQFLVNLFLDMFSGFLHSYFSDQFMNLIWNRILPVYNSLAFIVIIWILSTPRSRLPSLEKMPPMKKQ